MNPLYANVLSVPRADHDMLSVPSLVLTTAAVPHLLFPLTQLLLTRVSGRPVYPLYAIVSGRPDWTADDISTVAANFTAAQSGFHGDVIQKLHAVNPRFKAVKYLNSHEAGGANIPWIERCCRDQILQYWAGNLSAPVAASDTAIQLVNATGIPASTAAGDYSDDGNSAAKYVMFLRIDDETLRVNGVRQGGDAGTLTVEVGRGLDGTAPAAHDAGAVVRAPVYNKNFPGFAAQGTLRYALDPTTALATEWLAINTSAAVRDGGFDGSWYDCFSASSFSANAADGSRVAQNPAHPASMAWNAAASRPYTPDDFGAANLARLQRVWAQVNLSSPPMILANNMHAPQYAPGTGNLRSFLEATGGRRPLDGYSQESFAGAETGGCGSPTGTLTYASSKQLYANLRVLADAAQRGLSSYPMVASAGCESTALEGMGAARDAFEHFGYALYLMGVNSTTGPTRLGVPAFYKPSVESTARYARVHERYFWRVGEPSQHAADVREYVATSGCTRCVTLARNFTAAVVLLNPEDEPDVLHLRRAGRFVDPLTGERFAQGDTVAVANKTGRILLAEELARAAPPLPVPPAEFHIGSMRVRSVQAHLDLRLRWWRSAALNAERQWFTNVSQWAPPAPMPSAVYAVEKYRLYESGREYDAYVPSPVIKKPACCVSDLSGSLEPMYQLPADAKLNATGVPCGISPVATCDVYTGLFQPDPKTQWCYRYFVEPASGVLRRFEEYLTASCDGDTWGQATDIDDVSTAPVASADLALCANCTDTGLPACNALMLSPHAAWSSNFVRPDRAALPLA